MHKTTTTLGEVLYDTANICQITQTSASRSCLTSGAIPQGTTPIAVDFFSFGFTDDGVQASEKNCKPDYTESKQKRQVITQAPLQDPSNMSWSTRLNIMEPNTYTGISPIADDPSFIVIEDLTDEDAPRSNICRPWRRRRNHPSI